MSQIFASLVELARARAHAQPAQSGYTFLRDGERDEATLSYAALDRAARAIAAQLQQHAAPGDRALLIFPPGLEFIAGLFGCLYAGVVAVPAYPPNPARLGRTLPRLRAIVRDCQPALALTTQPSMELAGALAAQDPLFQPIRWIAADGLPGAQADEWRERSIEPDDIALIQYTSGSTADPKGVVLTHANLLHNSALIHQAFGHTPASQGVIWLPPYHDMGLIGGILQPLYGGFPVALMAPAAFLQRPARWLQAITRFGATTSGGPNFAYDLCVRKIADDERAAFDLRSWQVAFSGAEPIQAATLDRFAAAFAGSGFRRSAFFPCYGLAEATLLVSGGPPAAELVVAELDAAALEQHRVADGGRQARRLVGCGRASLDVQIADATTGEPRAPGQVGEIWVRGASVAAGYWGQPDATRETFAARLAGGDGPFLRTGDLGFVRAGQLFVTGRIKDLIILRGRNHYPQDIEQTAEQAHPALQRGGCAAFTVERDGDELLVVVQEVDRQQRRGSLEPAIDAIRQAVAEAHEISAGVVALIKPGTLPKTTSGKIQRRRCRERFLAGELELLALSDRAEVAEVAEGVAPAASPAARRAQLQEYLRDQAARALRVVPAALDMARPISAYGLDSLAAIELQHQVESDLGVPLAAVRLLEGASLAELADDLLAALDAPARGQPAPAAPASAEFELTYGQRALWFLHQLAPESPAYNIASAVRLAADLDAEALRRAFVALASRHAALRTTISTARGQPTQRVHPHASLDLAAHDASGWSEAELRERLDAAALRPFDLERGPLLRIELFGRGAREHVLLLVIHHLVADFWSLAVLLRELLAIYQAERAGTPAQLPPPQIEYAEFVRRQSALLASPEGERLWSYWRGQLSGAPPSIELPTDRPRPPVQTYRGGARALRLGAELSQAVRDLGQAHGATLYMTLLAAFQVLLLRYTGQDDMLIGSPTAGRTSADTADLVGYCVNPLVLRAQLAGDPTFAEVLRQARSTALAAFEHQQFPFALLAERLDTIRDTSRSPLFQVMFTLQQAPHAGELDIAPLALGLEGARVAAGELVLESVELARAAQFDLTLMVAADGAELTAVMQYNADLFDGDTIARMLEHYQVLLAGAAADATRPIGLLPLLGAAERRRVLYEWNATDTSYPRERCIHQLIEAQAARAPGATAVIFNDQQLSYGELDSRANRLAAHLRERGVGPDVIVGVCLERSLDLVVGLLAILKAGGAYLPLDPSYPRERLAFMLGDARAAVVLAQRRLAERLPDLAAADAPQAVWIDDDWPAIARQPAERAAWGASAEQLAYVIYTSGSTGRPKGVMIAHRSVVNFFAGMDARVGCGPGDTLLAVTSISFDISVLELFWPLARGARVVLLAEGGLTAPPAAAMQARPLDFSLFYFASSDTAGRERYRLVMEGARFADEHGFAAIWTPERHFHAFGGLYPSPAVMGAALAAITQRVQIRAGSVVLPLHHPIRVAEDWSLVDNLSGGRVGVAFAAGWHADDFVFFPEHYDQRKQLLAQGIATVRQLWRGERVAARGGGGNTIDIAIFPRPIQPELPIWITAAGNPETFEQAGALGAHVLTHLLGQSLDEVAEKIARYRAARERHGHDPQAGCVTLMLHTLIGENREAVRELVRAPFTEYLRSSVGLIGNLARSLNLPADLSKLGAQDMDDLLAFAFERYFESSALFGSVASCRPMIERLKAIGVDEVACLIDFGVDADVVLEGLRALDALRADANAAPAADYSLAAQAARHGATLLQCTPSLMRMLALDPAALAALGGLRALLLGGEALPQALARELLAALPGCQLINMYGPTETTIWSATQPVAEPADAALIGRPIANTRCYILDRWLEPVPVGVAGELYIGGAGLARGYLGRPELTAERFVRDPFGAEPDARLYRSGDLARFRPGGAIEFLGRADDQVKLRGHRIELEEIERVLGEHPDVGAAALAVRALGPDDQRLVADVVPRGGQAGGEIERDALIGTLRAFLGARLPEYMLPSAFVLLGALPLTANGKPNRRALPAPEPRQLNGASGFVAPRSQLEQQIAAIWRQVLQVEQIGIHDSFFDLGGHSLLMAQAHSLLREALGRDLPLIKLLEHPTVGALAQYLSQDQPAQQSFEPSHDRAKKQREMLARQRQRVKYGA